jgi:hypothetical protein
MSSLKRKRRKLSYLQYLMREKELVEFLLERAKTKEDEKRFRKRLAEITMEISKERGRLMIEEGVGW